MAIILGINNSVKLAKRIARLTGSKYIQVEASNFPDGDKYLRVKVKDEKIFKNKNVIIIESFFPNPDETLLNLIFLSDTLKDFGAKKLTLVAPYLSFMRQDKRFNPGEAINARIMAKIINNYYDRLITIDPHLHRIRKMKEIFTINAKNLTSNKVIEDYINKRFKSKKDLVVIGPDWESFQWADYISKDLNLKDTVLNKTRYTSKKVEVHMKDKIDFNNKTVIIIDDIISTGNTMIKAAKKVRKNYKPKKLISIGIHGIFANNAYKKMQKYFDEILTTNTIEHETNKLDVSDLIINELRLKKVQNAK